MGSDELEWWGMADDLGLLPDPILAVAQLRATILNAAGVRAAPADFLPKPPPTDDQVLDNVLRALPRMKPKG